MLKSVQLARLLMICLLGMAGFLAATPPEKAPEIRISTRNAADKVELATPEGKVVLTIESQRGIGQARLERGEAPWPERITIRLTLQGLESFTVANGVTTLHLSVASHGDHAGTITLIENGKEGPPLGMDSPHWTAIVARDGEGRPVKGLPGKGGYFELVLPAVLMKDNPAGLELAWIDFYRG